MEEIITEGREGEELPPAAPPSKNKRASKKKEGEGGEVKPRRKRPTIKEKREAAARKEVLESFRGEEVDRKLYIHLPPKRDLNITWDQLPTLTPPKLDRLPELFSYRLPFKLTLNQDEYPHIHRGEREFIRRGTFSLVLGIMTNAGDVDQFRVVKITAAPSLDGYTPVEEDESGDIGNNDVENRKVDRFDRLFRTEWEVLEALKTKRNIIQAFNRFYLQEKVGMVIFIRYPYTLNEYIQTEQYKNHQPQMFHYSLGSILHGLVEIHNAGFIHMDLTGDNILVRPSDQENVAPEIVIADFNESIKIKPGKVSPEDVSLKWNIRAPEMLPDEVNASALIQATEKVDVWSLGLLITRMLINDGTEFFPNKDFLGPNELILGNYYEIYDWFGVKIWNQAVGYSVTQEQYILKEPYPLQERYLSFPSGDNYGNRRPKHEAPTEEWVHNRFMRMVSLTESMRTDVMDFGLIWLSMMNPNPELRWDVIKVRDQLAMYLAHIMTTTTT